MKSRVFDIVRQAQTAALKIARPGVPLDAIDAAARDVIAAAGYGPGFRFFTHRLGHGLGIDMHEWPYLVRHNMFGWDQSPTARAGMTFSNEPGVYIRGEFGIRLEDDMVITESGAELLSPQSAPPAAVWLMSHPYGVIHLDRLQAAVDKGTNLKR